MLYRLVVFVLLIWVVRALIGGAGRIFGGSPARSRVSEPPPQAPANPARQKLDLSKDDVIDVTYTDVDPKS